jgi:hypothetical protein
LGYLFLRVKDYGVRVAVKCKGVYDKVLGLRIKEFVVMVKGWG